MPCNWQSEFITSRAVPYQNQLADTRQIFGKINFIIIDNILAKLISQLRHFNRKVKFK